MIFTVPQICIRKKQSNKLKIGALYLRFFSKCVIHKLATNVTLKSMFAALTVIVYYYCHLLLLIQHSIISPAPCLHRSLRHLIPLVWLLDVLVADNY